MLEDVHHAGAQAVPVNYRGVGLLFLDELDDFV